ncbi:MAG: GNAT family N-acetyltransferase [Deltaproteobacteria bacterium]|nr:GNAT family N-acetyltransferase [Deltaproteobacteria bacterium]
MKVSLREIISSDIPLIESWLEAEHVRRFWSVPATNLCKLCHPTDKDHWSALVEFDCRAVGLVCWQHPTQEELDDAGLFDIPATVIDIDIMIGDVTKIGRGLGTGIISLVANIGLSNPCVPFLIAVIMKKNYASQRAFLKAGFHVDREFDDIISGQCILLVRHRPHDRLFPDMPR